MTMPGRRHHGLVAEAPSKSLICSFSLELTCSPAISALVSFIVTPAHQVARWDRCSAGASATNSAFSAGQGASARWSLASYEDRRGIPLDISGSFRSVRSQAHGPLLALGRPEADRPLSASRRHHRKFMAAVPYRSRSR